MINGLNGGIRAPLKYFKLAFIYLCEKNKKKQNQVTLTLLGSTVTMEIKDEDVTHRGMVTSGCERPCFAIPDTVTQQRDKGNGLW